jgi:hypothetical protein
MDRSLGAVDQQMKNVGATQRTEQFGRCQFINGSSAKLLSEPQPRVPVQTHLKVHISITSKQGCMEVGRQMFRFGPDLLARKYVSRQRGKFAHAGKKGGRLSDSN